VTEYGRAPRHSTSLLRRILPADTCDDVLADLEELYVRRAARYGSRKARLWYRAQVLSYATRFGADRVRSVLRRDAGPLRRDAGPLGRDAGPLRRDAGPLGRDAGPLGRDAGPLGRDVGQLGRDPIRSGGGPLSAVSWLDWRLGVRMLLKHPALTIIGGFSLAAAIAIGSVGIEVANELLYKRLPFAEGERVVSLETRDAATSRTEQRVLHDFAIWRESLETVTELGAARLVERNVLTGEGRVEPLRVAEITASAFPLTRVPPLLGRPLQPADEVPGADPVVVLGFDLWQTQFLGDAAIIGRVVSVGRTQRTVVGVMPPRFGFPRNEQLWVPLPVQDVAPRAGPPVQVFGRLADGASWQDAAAELDVVTARLAERYPVTHAQLRTRVRAFAGRTPGDPLEWQELLMHVVVLLVLGAVCANVATLIFARTAMRESEIVVRSALGASRARVITQIVTESLVLALAGAVIGLVVAQTVVRYAGTRTTLGIDEGLPFWVDLTLEPATIAYALLLALIAAALIGVLPALKATGAAVQRGLQGMTSAGTAMKFGGIWSFIIGAQVAFTLICLPAAAGIFTELVRDQAIHSEFPAERFLTFRLSMDSEALPSDERVPDDAVVGARRALAYEELARRLRQEPGVTHVTFGDRLPAMSPQLMPVEVQRDGAEPVRLQGKYDGYIAVAAVGDAYHDAFGADVVAGRALHPGDAGAANRPVLVNEAFMREIGTSPVGARVRTLPRRDVAEPGPWHEIVGVTTDLGMDPTDRGEAEYMYRAVSVAELDPVVVAVRVAGDAAPLAPRVATLVRQVDPGLQLRDVMTLHEIIARRQTPRVVATLVFGIVLLMALTFSAAGLYALMAVAVQRRTREIGIRIALGANPQRVLRTVFARAGRQLGGGIVAGNAVILFIAWRVGGGIDASIVIALVVMSVIMAAVGVLACAAPARRALRVQPTEALRQG
jgi:putative ABC transport system permease protein